MQLKDEEFTLRPTVGVGMFKICSSIEDYINVFNMEYEPADEITGLSTYIVRQLGITLWVKGKIIQSIKCTDKLFYLDINLIGTSIESLDKKIGRDYKILESDIDVEFLDFKIFDIDELALQLWCTDGLIKEVMVSNYDYDF